MTETDSRGNRVAIRLPQGDLVVHLSLVGRHNVSNAVASAAAAMALNIAPEVIRAGLEQVRFVPGRLQRVEPDDWPFSVLVDYAHTDAALASVLDAVRPITRGRLICVFGCGGDRDRGKRPRMAAVAGRRADLVYVTTDNPRTENPRVIIDDILTGFDAHAMADVAVEEDRGRAIGRAITEARAGDTVLIAGKGHESYQLVGTRRLPFDDVEVARAHLRALVATEQVA